MGKSWAAVTWRASQIRSCLFSKKILKGFSVACVQETHGDEDQSRLRVQRLGFLDGIFSLHTRSTRGAAVLWRKPFFKIAEWIHQEGRIAAAVLGRENSSKKVLVVSVYAPNTDPSIKSQEHYMSFLITLEHVLTELTLKYKPDRTVVMGDFNLV